MSTGLFLPNLSSPNLEQLVVGSSPIQKNKKNGAHKAVYHFGWTSRLRNLLRNSPPDCFFQICLRQIWSSLSLVRVQFKKTKRTEHIRQYTILVGLQGCATCYETVHRTVSSKFVFAKFGAACRWFESINSERKADTQKRIGFSLAPQVGLEPTTLRLTAACSTN
jgi:hypothetical protein